MPFFIFILLYALGTLLFISICIPLNKKYKWITIKDLNNLYDGDMRQFFLVLGIITWPFTVFFFGVMKCITLFIDFLKNYIPKE